MIKEFFPKKVPLIFGSLRVIGKLANERSRPEILTAIDRYMSCSYGWKPIMEDENMYAYTNMVKVEVRISLTTEDIERLIDFEEVNNDDGTSSVIIERIKPHSFGERNIYDRSYVSEEADLLYIRFMKEQEKYLAKLKELRTRQPE